ncbi:MAG: ribokinase [Microbacteriaceae bacterium]|nr:ribokinase [Microbacteriaceae bacterium]
MGNLPAGAVVVVGSINLDQIVTVGRHPQPGETLIGTSMTLLPGGKGANQAVAAARLGASVTMIGAVGDDVHATAATSLLVGSGVDVSRVATASGPTGLAIVTVDSTGENTIVVVPGANASMDGQAVETHADAVSGAAVVVLQGEIPATGISAAMRLASGRVVLNLAPVIDIDPEIVRAADPLVVNEHEAGLLLTQLVHGDSVPDGDGGLVAALRLWGIRSVVLTRGAKGAICSDSSGTYEVPAPTVTAVDSSGAGDAFVGALSGALAEGSTLLAAVRNAVRVGAFAVQSSGTQSSYPTLNDRLPEVNR